VPAARYMAAPAHRFREALRPHHGAPWGGAMSQGADDQGLQQAHRSERADGHRRAARRYLMISAYFGITGTRSWTILQKTAPNGAPLATPSSVWLRHQDRDGSFWISTFLATMRTPRLKRIWKIFHSRYWQPGPAEGKRLYVIIARQAAISERRRIVHGFAP
jgi:hypothetical protein